MTGSKFRINSIHLILIYFLVFGLLYLFITPPFESPDEYLHLDYVNYISKYKSLPNQYEGIKDPIIFVGQGHQHPFYYMLVSVLVNQFSKSGIIDYLHPSRFNKNWSGGIPDEKIYANVFTSNKDNFVFYFIRFISLLFTLVNLYFIYKISSLFFTDNASRLLAVFIAASIPQFQFISSVINNDSMSNMLATSGIYFLLKIIDSPIDIKMYIFAAVSISLGILTKKTVMFILPCAAFLILYLIIKHKGIKFNVIIYRNSLLF